MDFAHGTMVTVRSTTTTDDGLGNTSEVVTESQWGPCGIHPRYATESTDPHAPRLLLGITILGPFRQMDSDDTLVLPDGHFYAGVWQIDGMPGDWDHPMTGWHPGIEVMAQRASAV